MFTNHKYNFLLFVEFLNEWKVCSDYQHEYLSSSGNYILTIN